MYNFPKYEPNKLNINPYILFSHNCYAYALDIISKKIKNILIYRKNWLSFL